MVAACPVSRIELGGGVEIALSRGAILHVLPAAGGGDFVLRLTMKSVLLRRKGSDSSPKAAGRPALPATVELRSRLARDAKAGRLAPTKEYVQWYARTSGKSKSVAGQTVRRELRRLGQAQIMMEQPGGVELAL